MVAEWARCGDDVGDSVGAVVTRRTRNVPDLEVVLEEAIASGKLPTGRKTVPCLVERAKNRVHTEKARRGDRYGARR